MTAKCIHKSTGISAALVAVALLSSCLAPKENGADPWRNGLLLNALASLKPVIYAANAAGTIAVLDPYSLTAGSSITTGCASSLNGLATDAAGRVLLAGCATNSVYFIDTAALTVRSNIPLSLSPSFVAFDESTGTAFAAGSTSLAAIDVTTERVLWTASLPYTAGSLTTMSGRVIVGLQTALTVPTAALALDARYGVQLASWTSARTSATMAPTLHVNASPDGSTLVSVETFNIASPAAALRLHGPETLQPTLVNVTTYMNLTLPAVNPVDGLIYVIDPTGMQYHTFSLDTGNHLGAVTACTTAPAAIAYSRFLDRLYVQCSAAMGLKAYDPRTGALLASVPAASYNSLAIVPGDRY